MSDYPNIARLRALYMGSASRVYLRRSQIGGLLAEIDNVLTDAGIVVPARGGQRPAPPPRYDEVFREGTAQLDAMGRGEIPEWFDGPSQPTATITVSDVSPIDPESPQDAPQSTPTGAQASGEDGLCVCFRADGRALPPGCCEQCGSWDR